MNATTREQFVRERELKAKRMEEKVVKKLPKAFATEVPLAKGFLLLEPEANREEERYNILWNYAGHGCYGFHMYP
jgi:hypothetical protein